VKRCAVPPKEAFGMAVISANLSDRFARLRERWSDPLLTLLTALLVCMMFVFAPLQTAQVFVFQEIEFAFALAMIVGVLILSGSPTATVILLLALVMNVVAAVLQLRQRTTLDIYLVAGAWLMLGITLAVVAAQAVFSPGRVTYHRIIGAVLLYLTIAVTFVALFTFVGLVYPKAFSGIAIEDSPALASNLIYFSFVTLTSTGYGDIIPVHPIARSLCNVESIIGQLYPATLLARLVTLELQDRR
jgi:hypothetical protein